ncbi:hypothetical protein L3Q82_013823, partial [Scortum barcoo]
MHSLGSGTQLLERGWSLHYSGVAQVTSRSGQSVACHAICRRHIFGSTQLAWNRPMPSRYYESTWYQFEAVDAKVSMVPVMAATPKTRWWTPEVRDAVRLKKSGHVGLWDFVKGCSVSVRPEQELGLHCRQSAGSRGASGEVCCCCFAVSGVDAAVCASKMTKLQLLNSYLTERLTAVVKEILDVVEDTVTEYREETARTRRENESLRRQLRDILLLEAETEWLRSTRSRLGFVAPEQQACDPEPRPRSEEPDSTLNQPRPPTHEQVVSVQLLSVQSETSPGPVVPTGDKKPSEGWEPVLRSDPQKEAFGKTSPLPSHPTRSPPSASAPKIHIEVPALREEPRAPAPALIKTEPEEFKVTKVEGHTDSLTATVTQFRKRPDADRTVVVRAERHEAPGNKTSSLEKPTVTSDEGAAAGFIPELVHRCPRCGEAFGQPGQQPPPPPGAEEEDLRLRVV